MAMAFHKNFTVKPQSVLDAIVIASIAAVVFSTTSNSSIIMAVDAAANCKCLAQPSNGLLPPSKFFVDKGFPSDYRSYCKVWDKNATWCQEGGDEFGAEWCLQESCYVAANSTCDPSALNTTFFADTEYAESLKFSMSGACPNNNNNNNNMIVETPNKNGQMEDNGTASGTTSSANIASAFVAVAVAVAAFAMVVGVALTE